MCDKTEPDTEGAGLASNPATEIDDRQDSFAGSVNSLGTPSSPSDRTASHHTAGGSGDTSGDSARENKPQFYIEVDASAMVNLKAGTQYTLVPVDSDQATAAAVNSIPTADIQTQQSLAWSRTMDGRLPGEETNGHTGEVVVSKEEIHSDAFGLEQSMMGTFDTTAVTVSKAEVPDTTLETDFEHADCSGADKEMTYTPLMTVSQQPPQPQQQPQPHDAAGAAAAAHMQHTGGYDNLRYRHQSPPMYVAPQHQTPYLVHPRATWAPYPGTSNTQVPELTCVAQRHIHLGTHHPGGLPGGYQAPFRCSGHHGSGSPSKVHPTSSVHHVPTHNGGLPAGRPHNAPAVQAAYLPLPASSHAAGAAGGAAANLGAGPSTSSAAAAAGSDASLHAALGGDDVTAAGDFGRAAAGAAADGTGNDIMGVARVANMGQIQHMVGPLDNVPYYMPFNGRENHNEKERKRRTRIKNACQTLRSLVPGLSEKTDKATVFEFTVQYLLHLRRHLGSKHDKSISQEFMEKYSPY